MNPSASLDDLQKQISHKPSLPKSTPAITPTPNPVPVEIAAPTRKKTGIFSWFGKKGKEEPARSQQTSPSLPAKSDSSAEIPAKGRVDAVSTAKSISPFAAVKTEPRQISIQPLSIAEEKTDHSSSIAKPAQKEDEETSLAEVFDFLSEDTEACADEIMKALGLDLDEKQSEGSITQSESEQLFAQAQEDLDESMLESQPLIQLAASVGSGIEEAKAATLELVRDELFPKNDAPREDQSPQIIDTDTPVSPDILDFSGDDDCWEEKLDELIGDLALDIKPLKEQKSAPVTARSELSAKSFVLDDELEIDFEIEDELMQPQSENGSVPGAKAELGAEELWDGVWKEFEGLAKDTKHIDIASPLAESPQTTKSNGNHHPQAPAAPAASPDKPSLRPAVKSNSELEALLDEMSILLAEAYGIDPESINPRQQNQKMELAALEDELENELRALIKEGTTFYSTEHQAEECPADPAPAEDLDGLSDLEQQLSEEIAALADEGFTIYAKSSAANSPANESEEKTDDSIEELAKQISLTLGGN